MDFIGPLPTTNDGNKYIVVATDAFTKWVEAKAIKKNDAETTAKFLLEEVIDRHEAPKRIITDQGKQFANELINEIAKLMDIRQSMITAYRLQTNGITERCNKTLVGIMIMYISKYQKDQDEILPCEVFAYQTAEHSSINESPFRMIYGREARLPMDFEYMLNSNKPEEMDNSEYMERLTKKLYDIRNEAKYFEDKLRQRRNRKRDENAQPLAMKLNRWCGYMHHYGKKKGDE